MTKKEKTEYMRSLVASQGTQMGISLPPLLEEIISGCEDVFVVEVEENNATTKIVTNTQEDIDAFIDAANEDPFRNVPKVHISGVVLSFSQLEVNDDEVDATVNMVTGHYVLKLSKTPGSSQLTFTAKS